jgi:hypothetical protein
MIVLLSIVSGCSVAAHPVVSEDINWGISSLVIYYIDTSVPLALRNLLLERSPTRLLMAYCYVWAPVPPFSIFYIGSFAKIIMAP